MDNLAQSAINAALENRWEEAVSFNETILKEKPNDTDALNRLAYAYTQLGKIDKAKKFYRKTLSFDKYNFIAQKNFDKLSSCKEKENTVRHEKTTISPNLFLEEPGKTKSVTLINPAPIHILSNLCIGDTIYLYPKKHSIEIRDYDKTHLGALPDDVAFRLLRFIKAKNTYHVCVKNVDKKGISVFIREIQRGKKFQSQPTFITGTSEYTSSTLRELKSVATSENEEENQEDPEE